ncbi:hypothetical protein PUN28_016477 [Cardiocondyla obscurior]|uniref:Uncharacterized protein n=1 Tax=Cardiocondyla obscurior TaxID=286306 RepID=A0AAW2EMA1_9HYME
MVTYHRLGRRTRRDIGDIRVDRREISRRADSAGLGASGNLVASTGNAENPARETCATVLARCRAATPFAIRVPRFLLGAGRRDVTPQRLSRREFFWLVRDVTRYDATSAIIETFI